MNRVIDLLKSGNFTVIYWDSSEPHLYKGKWEANEKYDGYYSEMAKAEVPLKGFEAGYCPEIVQILVKALGGNTDSI